MKLSPVVFVDRNDLKKVHDELVQAWEDQHSESFNEALDKLEHYIVTVPRKSYGSRKIYDKDSPGASAKAIMMDPSIMEIECID